MTKENAKNGVLKTNERSEMPSSELQKLPDNAIGIIRNEADTKKEEKAEKPKRRRKRGKKKYIFLALLLVAGAGFWFTKDRFFKPKEILPSVTEAQVENRDIEDTVVIEGPVQGSETAEVTSPINSEIIKINVKEGDYVTKGQVLAVLDGKDMNNEIRQAEQRLQLSRMTMQESVEKEQHRYDTALIAVEDAKRKAEQNKSLFEAGALSEEEYRLSVDELERAQNALSEFNVVNGKVVASEAQKKSIQVDSNAIEMKRQDLQKLVIKSPINGTITRVNARLGRYANDTENKAAMFVIEDLEQLNMKVRVPENQIGKVRIGQNVNITANILGEDILSGVVDSIAPSGEDKDGNGTQKVIPITIRITGKNSKMIPGVNAKAKIMIESRKGVLSIPGEAIQSDFESNNKVVYKIMEDNTLKKVEIKTGLEDVFYSEVLEGDLKVGDRLVRNSETPLSEGMKVEISTDTKEGMTNNSGEIAEEAAGTEEGGTDAE